MGITNDAKHSEYINIVFDMKRSFETINHNHPIFNIIDWQI